MLKSLVERAARRPLVEVPHWNFLIWLRYCPFPGFSGKYRKKKNTPQNWFIRNCGELPWERTN